MGRRDNITAPEQAAPEESVCRVFAERQEWIVDRSIELAKLNGYAPYTTTIRAAWVEAIQSVTDALGQYLARDCDGIFGPRAEIDYRRDPRFSRMRQIARQHRALGITLPMYAGLLKHFRNIYLEILADRAAAPTALSNRVRDFFDETELSVVADWTEAGGRGRLREIQQRTRALTLEKDRYFAIFESIRDPAFLLDRRNRVLNANQAAAELILGEAHAGDITYLRSMRRRKDDLQARIDTILAGMDGASQTCWLAMSEETRCYDIRMRALHDAVENMAIGFVLVLHDVTAHQNAVDEAKRAKQQMSRFLATMSHEIRTPLHSVLGAADLLRASGREAQEDFLGVIESAGQSLLQTLSNVLDYSKLENSAPVPRPVATHLGRALSSFQRVVEAGNRNAGVGVTIALDPDLPEVIGIDWNMARQVLFNLVTNAVRFDDGQGVSVSVSTAGPASPPDRVCFEVSDHGPGISDIDAKALFRPFAEIIARDTGHDGAGLGLAICHNLVEAMGGEIGYETRPGATLIGFTLPYSTVAPEERPGRPGGREPRPSQHFRRCLLVDDDPAGAMITGHQLAEYGYEVRTVSGVTEALEAATQHRFDLFVLDYLMPDGDGLSLVRALRRDHATAVFVALTANVEAIRDSETGAELFDRVLAKPVDRMSLGEALHDLDPGICAEARTTNATAVFQGLSKPTIQAMADAFEGQWSEFCACLKRAEFESQRARIGHAAHRLAGSCAIIGLTELERPLRRLEECCAAGGAAEEIALLSAAIEPDLGALPSWHRVLVEGGRA